MTDITNSIWQQKLLQHFSDRAWDDDFLKLRIFISQVEYESEQKGRREAAQEILNMKREAINEKEAILPPLWFASISPEDWKSPPPWAEIRNLVYVKAHDITLWAEEKNIILVP